MIADERTGRREEAAVARTSISKTDLELMALQQIRSFPGGEHAVSVEVECVAGEARDVTWRLHVTAKDEADFGRIHYAAETTTERLKRRYCLKR
ncbi:bsr7705 [Bradyrhizobium diazoefficiens USDA 110]|uniref:Bsr7705 protein n=2 Tax=Bradyrhizobium diazoefficiens TaxID=1355477 RepID=Q89CU0_BRADU|nr:hypothetical protein [Bradyrhizobium diazoefficiens]AND92611.1 hypothetical protein AAV28_36225 [Bradyrhizobium diazoefficiens USDA 110]KGJ71343.1 hypothetical protein BJA5080_07770 [Bradyrhizobium diazoefficiens SEMIA 5080]MDA9390216.1 hypothetical protein [Bradyrhizobium sp. CCBAU 45394]APO52085.1 hypothetical protein BD122_17475 [Bradyrhizobium diazoefficiens]KOY04542.1 hypothetical protein AF336_41590 [Bradyrhizobium diazoefficiens]